ncbi:MAG TPA: lmo0937 family membrane protein [Candidatus Sulfotelmatobacter sp.]|nr:lmo0937 family membrane protein [Candidatus Sulfotelmatobacter sp.]
MRFGPLLLIGILLFIFWIGAFAMYHVTSGLIHLLLLFAVISFIAHLFTGSRAT